MSNPYADCLRGYWFGNMTILGNRESARPNRPGVTMSTVQGCKNSLVLSVNTTYYPPQKKTPNTGLTLAPAWEIVEYVAADPLDHQIFCTFFRSRFPCTSPLQHQECDSDSGAVQNWCTIAWILWQKEIRSMRSKSQEWATYLRTAHVLKMCTHKISRNSLYVLEQYRYAFSHCYLGFQKDSRIGTYVNWNVQDSVCKCRACGFRIFDKPIAFF